MCLALTLPLWWSASNQHVLRLLVATGTVSQRRLAPGRLRIAAGAGTPLTTAMRMVEGVHGDAADGGALATPAALAGFADVLVFVLDVADLADRRIADDSDAPHFSGRHPDLRVVPLAGEQLRRHAGGADHLTALSVAQLDVVHRAAQRDVRERQRIPRFDVGLRAADHLVTDRQADGRQDVALLAIGVGEQRDPGAAVRVVFDRADGRRDIQLVALEIDDPVELSVAAALVANGDLSLRVAAGIGLEGHEKALLGLLRRRDLVEGAHRHEAAARRGGTVLLYRHRSDTLEHAFDLLSLGQRDDRLFPVRLEAVGLAPAAFLAAHVHGVDADDLDLEGLRDRQRDLGFGRPRVHSEEVFAGRHRGVALLTDERTLDHLDGRSHDSHSSTWVSADRVKMMVSAVSTSVGLRFCARMVLTPARLRVDFSSIRSCSGMTNRVRAPAPSWSKRPAMTRVLGASSAISSTMRTASSCDFTESAERSASRRCLRGIFCS